MKVEPSRDPEIFWHVWAAPKWMAQDEAELFFRQHIKPKPYTYEKFKYDPRAGRVMTA
jgi:hypothetical protein